MSKYVVRGLHHNAFVVGVAALGAGIAALGFAWGARAQGSTVPVSAPTAGAGQNDLAGDSGDSDDDFDANGMVRVYTDDGQAQDDKPESRDESTRVLDPMVAEFGPPGSEVALVCCASGGLCMYYSGDTCPAGEQVKCPCQVETESGS